MQLIMKTVQKHLSPLQLWGLAIRPKTLPASGGPIAVGCGVALACGAGGATVFLPTLACLFCSVLLQIGVNLANDYFDFRRGIDGERRQGPVRVTQSGLISPERVRLGMVFSLMLAGLLFLYLAVLGGWPIVLVGAASLLAALAYSGGPWPLASHGLGEVFAFLFYGPVGVCATAYILLGTLPLLALLASLPPGFLIAAVMVINNLRDIETDRAAGKISLAVRLGRWRTIQLYKSLVWLSYFVPPVLVVTGLAGPFVVLPLFTALLARRVCVVIECAPGDRLNALLGETARLSLFYSIMLAFGLGYNF